MWSIVLHFLFAELHPYLFKVSGPPASCAGLDIDAGMDLGSRDTCPAPGLGEETLSFPFLPLLTLSCMGAVQLLVCWGHSFALLQMENV